MKSVNHLVARIHSTKTIQKLELTDSDAIDEKLVINENLHQLPVFEPWFSYQLLKRDLQLEFNRNSARAY